MVKQDEEGDESAQIVEARVASARFGTRNGLARIDPGWGKGVALKPLCR
jgi:hypothetical protein